MKSVHGECAFWSLRSNMDDVSARQEWCRLVIQLQNGSSWDAYAAVEAGVPAALVIVMGSAFGKPTEKVLRLLGLSAASFRRCMSLGRSLPELVGHRVIAAMRLAATLRQMIEGNGVAERSSGFDPDAWLGSWLEDFLPAFPGIARASLLWNPEGQRVLDAQLHAMQGGLVA